MEPTMSPRFPSRFPSRKGRKGLTNERGAALVEASIVIGVLVVFLGCMVFVKDSYKGKIQQQHDTRLNAFGYAAHNCEGGGDASKDPSNSSIITSTDPATNKVVSQGPGGSATQGISDKTSNTLALSHATKTDKIQGRAHGYATQGASLSNGTGTDAVLTRQIRSDSYMFCNEHPYDADPISFGSFFFKFFKSGLL
jgi:hypothetical protein